MQASPCSGITSGARCRAGGKLVMDNTQTLPEGDVKTQNDKKARQIIGLPVITFNKGTKIYDVEDLIIDPQRRQVLALVVSEGAFFHSARAVPFGRISAIGPHAVI